MTAVTMDSTLHSSDKGPIESFSPAMVEALEYIASIPEEQRKHFTHIMKLATQKGSVDAEASMGGPSGAWTRHLSIFRVGRVRSLTIWTHLQFSHDAYKGITSRERGRMGILAGMYMIQKLVITLCRQQGNQGDHEGREGRKCKGITGAATGQREEA